MFKRNWILFDNHYQQYQSLVHSDKIQCDFVIISIFIRISWCFDSILRKTKKIQIKNTFYSQWIFNNNNSKISFVCFSYTQCCLFEFSSFILRIDVVVLFLYVNLQNTHTHYLSWNQKTLFIYFCLSFEQNQTAHNIRL